MRTSFLKIDEVIEDVISFVEYKTYKVPQVKKLISDFVRKIETDQQYEHVIFWAPVKDYVADIHPGMKTILQVSYRPVPSVPVRSKMEIVEWSQRAFDDSECKYKITLDCPKCHKEECDHRGAYVTIDVDDITRQQHPEYMYMHMDHLYRWGGMNKKNIPYSKINSDFRVIKYAEHFYHNTKYHIPGCLNLNPEYVGDSKVEYTIPTPDILRLNREDGEVLVSCLASRVDEDGFSLVPDIPEIIEAIRWYYEEHAAYKEWRKYKNGNDLNAYRIASANRTSLQSVINEMMQTPEQEQWFSFLSNRWKRTLKDNNFMGNNNAQVGNIYDNKLNKLINK